MKKEIRTIVYDEELRLEAYHIEGTRQAFPVHFHEHYVLGLLERGRRQLFCGQSYNLGPGCMVLFNPEESHGCAQVGEEPLDYRGLNIERETMLDWAGEVTGRRELPGFAPTVVYDAEISGCLRRLHEMIMRGGDEFAKEETWLLLLSVLIQKYGQPFAERVPECRREIDRACGFMERHFAERIYLDQICRCAGLSKSALLRAFTKARGVTPYRYLENIRINEAKKLLGQGVSPLETALRTGFADQSHFTNYFGRFIGLTPGAYREIFVHADNAGDDKEDKENGE